MQGRKFGGLDIVALRNGTRPSDQGVAKKRKKSKSIFPKLSPAGSFPADARNIAIAVGKIRRKSAVVTISERDLVSLTNVEAFALVFGDELCKRQEIMQSLCKFLGVSLVLRAGQTLAEKREQVIGHVNELALGGHKVNDELAGTADDLRSSDSDSDDDGALNDPAGAPDPGDSHTDGAKGSSDASGGGSGPSVSASGTQPTGPGAQQAVTLTEFKRGTAGDCFWASCAVHLGSWFPDFETDYTTVYTEDHGGAGPSAEQLSSGIVVHRGVVSGHGTVDFDRDCAPFSMREQEDATHLREWTVSWMHDLGTDLLEDAGLQPNEGSDNPDDPKNHWGWRDYFGRDVDHAGMRQGPHRRGDHRGLFNSGGGDRSGEWADTAAIRAFATVVHIHLRRRIVLYRRQGGSVRLHSVLVPFATNDRGNETPAPVESGDDFVPRLDDITLLFSGVHYDVLHLQVPPGCEAAAGELLRAGCRVHS